MDSKSLTDFIGVLLISRMTNPSRIPAALNLPFFNPITCTPYRIFISLKLLASNSLNPAPKESIPAILVISVLPWLFFNVRDTVLDSFPRNNPILILSPGRYLLNCSESMAPFLIFTPLIKVITSPSFIPASIAALRLYTSPTYIPSCTSRFSSLANSESISLYPIPNTALCTVPYSFKSAITLLTMEVGIANE